MKQDDLDLIECFEQGKRARYHHGTPEDNPFPEHTMQRRKWYEGWCEANLRQHLARHPELR